MSISTIKSYTNKVARKTMFEVQHYSPEILTTVGIIGVVTSGVLAARATLKLEGVVAHAERRLNTLANKRAVDGVSQKEVAGVYARNVFDLVKLYGPSITLGAVSIVAIVSAHGIMRKRNLGLLAAYKAVETAYSNYRQRVIDEYGEDKDRDFVNGVYQITETDPETGKKKKTVKYGEPVNSEYIFTFGDGCPNWQRDFPDQNVFFLTIQQNNANDRLRSRGFLILNDVLESIGLPHTSAGAVVGWTLGPEGDGYVDFGMTQWSNIYAGANEDGREGHIRLNFNVDGPVWDKIDKVR